MDSNKPLKIVFAPGCFDDFEGTQEDLDAMQAEIMQLFESGEFLEKSTPIDFDELFNEDPELAEKLAAAFDADATSRKLH
ncbi:MAG TPA: hypothetical protein VFM18_18040 [Methanosarcina sp.]|nr:hypothetical protein [Methanosarcina sp.]